MNLLPAQGADEKPGGRARPHAIEVRVPFRRHARYQRSSFFVSRYEHGNLNPLKCALPPFVKSAAEFCAVSRVSLADRRRQQNFQDDEVDEFLEALYWDVLTRPCLQPEFGLDLPSDPTFGHFGDVLPVINPETKQIFDVAAHVGISPNGVTRVFVL